MKVSLVSGARRCALPLFTLPLIENVQTFIASTALCETGQVELRNEVVFTWLVGHWKEVAVLD